MILYQNGGNEPKRGSLDRKGILKFEGEIIPNSISCVLFILVHMVYFCDYVEKENQYHDRS